MHWRHLACLNVCPVAVARSNQFLETLLQWQTALYSHCILMATVLCPPVIGIPMMQLLVTGDVGDNFYVIDQGEVDVSSLSCTTVVVSQL